MNVVIYGATGMVGQGVLRECLLDRDVERVLTVGRRESGQKHEKVRDLVLSDLTDYSGVHVTTTERVRRAMLNVARHGAAKAILENDDIDAAADGIR